MGDNTGVTHTSRQHPVGEGGKRASTPSVRIFFILVIDPTPRALPLEFYCASPWDYLVVAGIGSFPACLDISIFFLRKGADGKVSALSPHDGHSGPRTGYGRPSVHSPRSRFRDGLVAEQLIYFDICLRWHCSTKRFYRFGR